MNIRFYWLDSEGTPAGGNRPSTELLRRLLSKSRSKCKADGPRTIFALVPIRGAGSQKVRFYATRQKACEAAMRLSGQFRIQEVQV